MIHIDITGTRQGLLAPAVIGQRDNFEFQHVDRQLSG